MLHDMFEVTSISFATPKCSVGLKRMVKIDTWFWRRGVDIGYLRLKNDTHSVGTKPGVFKIVRQRVTRLKRWIAEGYIQKGR